MTRMTIKFLENLGIMVIVILVVQTFIYFVLEIHLEMWQNVVIGMIIGLGIPRLRGGYSKEIEQDISGKF